MKTIGVFGLSGNPPHMGHVMCCLKALSFGLVDHIYVIPAYRHALGKDLISFKDRTRMIKMAFEPLGRMATVLGVEEAISKVNDDDSPVYMIEVIEWLEGMYICSTDNDDHEKKNLRLLLGTDLVNEFEKWYRHEELRERAEPIFMQRTTNELSSTEIRKLIDCGGYESYLSDHVPEKVLSYIGVRGLFQCQKTI